MGSNRVRTSMKRGTPPITYNFWAYDTVESDPHSNYNNIKRVRNNINKSRDNII